MELGRRLSLEPGLVCSVPRGPPRPGSLEAPSEAFLLPAPGLKDCGTWAAWTSQLPAWPWPLSGLCLQGRGEEALAPACSPAASQLRGGLRAPGLSKQLWMPSFPGLTVIWPLPHPTAPLQCSGCWVGGTQDEAIGCVWLLTPLYLCPEEAGSWPLGAACHQSREAFLLPAWQSFHQEHPGSSGQFSAVPPLQRGK